jgi:hypothetical protein
VYVNIHVTELIANVEVALVAEARGTLDASKQ